MKSMMKVLFIAVLAVSCTKPNEKVDIVAEKTNMLISGTWRFIDYSYRDAFTSTSYASLPDCRKDDLYIFKNDGTYEINEGVSKCNSTDPQSKFFQWKFLNDHATHIELNGKDFVVDNINDSQFKVHSYSLDPYAPETSYTFSK